MRALLLAAGLGTRLRPITDSIPKCLVPIHGRPLLGYWFDMLLKSDVERVLVNTHYFAQAVNDFVAASSWRDRIDLVYEPELLGTGGTVLRNREWLGQEPFMLIHADNLSRFDVSGFVSAHRQRPEGTEMTMMTFDTDAPRASGIVETDQRGVVLRFHEKVPNPPGTRANAAVYIFEPSIFPRLESLGRPFVDISLDILPHLMGKIATYHNAIYHRDIGTPESLRQAEREFVPG